MANIELAILENGVGVATIDMPDRPFNVFSEQMMSDLEAVVTRASNELRGLVLTSGKRSFLAGADLVMIKDFSRMRFDADKVEMRDRFSRLGRLFRQIELSPVPVVAAINGLALGGGLEVAMACHGRVCVDSDSPMLGLPEVKLGLLPGAGGTQRLPRLIGLKPAMQMLLTGDPVSPSAALDMGLVDALASPENVINDAVEMALKIEPLARWDRPGYAVSADEVEQINSDTWQTFCLEQGGWQSREHSLYPAVGSIVRCVERGFPLSMDAGCDAEWDIFVDLMSDPVAANMVVTCFLNKGLAEGEGSEDQAARLREQIISAVQALAVNNELIAKHLMAVDARALISLVDLSCDSTAVPAASDDRNAGVNALALVAIDLRENSDLRADVLDALAVLKLGWPMWTGGPISLLAMIQREEISGWIPSTEVTRQMTLISEPLKQKASYSSS